MGDRSEDGLGEVVADSSSASADSRLTGNISSKSLVDNTDSENLANSFEEGDEAEIMVEVVGSDVFVDGVSSRLEGDSGSGEVEDLEGHVWEKRREHTVFSEGNNVSGGGNEDKNVDNQGSEVASAMESSEACAPSSEVVGVVNEEACNLVTEAVTENDGKSRKYEVAEDLQVEVDGKLDFVDEKEVPFSGNSSSENLDSSGTYTAVPSEATAAMKGLQTSPSGADQILEFDDVMDFEVGPSNVSAEITSIGNDEILDSDFVLVGDEAHQTKDLATEERQVDSNTIEGNKDQNMNFKVESVNDDENIVVSVNLSDLLDDRSTLVAGEFSNEKEEADEETSQHLYHTETTKSERIEADPGKANGISFEEDPVSEKNPMDLERDSVFQYGNMLNPEKIFGEFGPEADQYAFLHEETQTSLRPLHMSQSGYLSAPEKEGRFSVADLVWGKVRSHPWWPGQVFDPADASDDAVKYYKKDSYLIAYFGDQTFGWNESSMLKPFRCYFSQMEKQSNSEAFRDAIDCTLEEVSRRVELGLSCSCLPQDAYSKIKRQSVRNSGIRHDSSERYGVDKSSKASHFQPVELLHFVRELAPRSSSGADQLDLVLARAQLSSFCRFKGYRSPPELSSSSESLENDAKTQHKHTPVDISESVNEKSVTELMDWEFSVDSLAEDAGLRKRKAEHSIGEYSEKRHAASARASSSFRIGECISRVASKLTGPGSDDPHKAYELSDRPAMAVSAESSSLDEMLSQIQHLACRPTNKERSFPRTTHSFLLGFRNSIALSMRARKKRSEAASGEEFEFHDVNDSYWTDRIVQNYSPEQLHNGENSVETRELAPYVAESVVKPSRRPYTRKRFSTGSIINPSVSAEPEEIAKKQKQEASPAELVVNFEDRSRVPSEISLNKLFRRFGALMESETEVDHASGRARVIFKRGFDAEVARDSSEKFKLFGPAAVSYQVGYSPLISVKISPIVQEDGGWMPMP